MIRRQSCYRLVSGYSSDRPWGLRLILCGNKSYVCHRHNLWSDLALAGCVNDRVDDPKRSPLACPLSVAEVELRAAAEERDKILNDANYNSLQSDEAVSRARQERDQAIERKKTAEVALAKTRVELMQANSQLYEAVRQKVDLGQQLEQWQMDMQELIDEQMKHKLVSQEKRRKLPEPAAAAPTRAARLLGFFQR
ncbi:hypothetical protein ACJJTC_006074 [Scirpophaga incertulas]